MKTWSDFAKQEPKIAALGEQLLFQEKIGKCFLATLRKDGAPRMHPVSLVLHKGHLYTLIPKNSPKCQDLLRDGRYALQAFPQPGEITQEFYISGYALCIQDLATRQNLIDATHILAGDDEVLFELLLERAMYTTLENYATPDEQPVHLKWRAA